MMILVDTEILMFVRHVFGGDCDFIEQYHYILLMIYFGMY